MLLQELILEDEVTKADNHIAPEVRHATISLLERLKKEFGKKHGFIFVLGYDPTDTSYEITKGDFHANDEFVSPMKDDHIDELTDRINVRDGIAYQILQEITHIDDDGAVLIDKDGYLLHNGYSLEVSPKSVLAEMKIPNHRTLGQRYGFSRNVGRRHNSAIAASYKLPNTEIYTLSEESEDIRGYYRTLIFCSPYEQELTDSRYGRPKEILDSIATRLPKQSRESVCFFEECLTTS
ncbi:MAG: hypothetical protein ABIJ21_05390 [Nanoarchaeota archaeon]